jgi:hypothetical protein
MPDKIKILGFSFLMLVILTSGCTSPVSQNNQGVVIVDFGPDMSEVYSGESVTFKLRISNEGSLQATEGFAELLGLDYIWSNEEVLPTEDECKYTAKGITLSPPNPEIGSSGEEKVCTWYYTAPTVSSGLYIEAKPKVRVFYNYKSFIIKTITLLPREELIRQTNAGNSLPIETKDESKSPISLDVVATTPIRTYGSSVTFPIEIKISNAGGGTVCLDSSSCRKSISGGDSWNKLRLTINLPSEMNLETCQQSEIITIPASKSQIISCKITTPEVTTLTQKQIEVRADYGYFIDKESYIKVAAPTV